MKNKLSHFITLLGPGVLFASTCIGVSHLVQSTRAGALYGFGLLWAVIAANLFKYPFFEYGSRYASATGESIIDGYRRTGKWMLWLYFSITLVSMFFVAAAVGAVTAGFLDNLFGISHFAGKSGIWWSVYGLFLICIVILLAGKYKALDSLIKIIGSVLLVSTLAAFFLTLLKGPVTPSFHFFTTEVFNTSEAGFAFLIALMGWMPTALDLSAWNSLWTLERIKQTGYRPTLRETLYEFNFGYLASAVLAPCFLLLGAYLLYGTDYVMPENSAAFAHAIIGLYTKTIGSWSYLLISAAAFSIMFGTCIAVFDGYARAVERVLEIMTAKAARRTASASVAFTSNSRYYNLTLLTIAAGALLVIFQFGSSMKNLVDLATTLSFIVAPVIAIVNFRLVRGRNMPADKRPPAWMNLLSYLGIVFLIAFTLVYLWWIV